jgi:hypothetical protein
VLHYGDTQAADLFSASVVEYLIAKYGYTTFRSVLTAGKIDFADIGKTEEEVSKDWRSYVEVKYGPQTKR